MNDHSMLYAEAIREAQRLRGQAMVDMWRKLREALSLHVPKLFPAEY